MSDFVVQSVSLDNPINYESMIRVVGVGGGGCNTLQYMINQSLQGVEFIAVNTDAQALNMCTAPLKVQIGVKLTNGLGAGSNPYRGRQAAEESREDLKQLLQGSRIVFLTTGMGGGTGTGATPVVAQVARELGALTIAVVTRPFFFEGKNRLINADAGISELRKYADSIVVIDNDKLLTSLGKNISIANAFNEANDVLYNAVRGISDSIVGTGFINLDLADVEIAMRNRGHALIGIGTGRGANFISDALHRAVHNPLMDTTDVKNATGMLVNAHVNPNFPISNWSLINDQLHAYTDPEADMKFGLIFDDSLQEDEIHIVIIITGFNTNEPSHPSNGKANSTRATAVPQNLGNNTPLPVISSDPGFFRQSQTHGSAPAQGNAHAARAPQQHVAQSPVTHTPQSPAPHPQQPAPAAQYAKAAGSDIESDIPVIFRNKI